jgi:hypothetical protein
MELIFGERRPDIFTEIFPQSPDQTPSEELL